jgi:mono/diheme cytochrome c family protein
MKNSNRWGVALLALLWTTGCGGEDDADDAGDAGATASATYFQGAESMALGHEGNQAACATCHSIDGSLGLSGSSMQNIAYLTAYKGGDAPTLLDAVNACVTGWMGGEALTADDPAYASLRAYLESLSDAAVTEPNELAPEVLSDADAYEAAYAGGDSAAGAAKYAAACGRCHDAGLVVNQVPAYSKASLKNYTVSRIAQKVRTSGPPPSAMGDAADSTPGPMPFFEPKDLSSADLKDIIAHLKAQ